MEPCIVSFISGASKLLDASVYCKVYMYIDIFNIVLPLHSVMYERNGNVAE